MGNHWQIFCVPGNGPIIMHMGAVLTGLNGLSKTKQNKIEGMKLRGAYIGGYRGNWTGKPAGSDHISL